MSFETVVLSDAVTLIRGDCLEVLPTLEDESVDLVIADPGYGLSKYGDWDQFNQSFHERWMTECMRVLRQTGTMYVFWGHKWLTAFLCMCPWDAIIYWKKPKPIINPESRRWVACVEHILWWHKGDDYTWNVLGRNATSLLNAFTDSLAMQAEGSVYHPNQKPISILRKLIARSSNQSDMILDPFCGSGTTLIAALETRRKSIGIEISEEYFEVAKKRLERELEQTRLKL